MISSSKKKSLLAALLLTEAFYVPAEAAVQTSPLIVTEKNQTVSDDFDVALTDGSYPAALVIAPSSADSTDGVIQVDSRNITGSYTQSDVSSTGEGNGIWVQEGYPGTVNLADRLTVKVDAAGDHYNASGIYLEGVDIHHGDPDESDAANDQYQANGNKISDTTVNVGNGTAISVTAMNPEGSAGTFLNSAGLENHFGHMTVGDGVTVSLDTGLFQQSYNAGFNQVYYGSTSIGNDFYSTVTSQADAQTGILHTYGLYSRHENPSSHENTALTRNQLTLGDHASLTGIIRTTDSNSSSQELASWGTYLSSTDFRIGNGLMATAVQTGVDEITDGASQSGNSYSIGIYTRRAKGSIGTGMKDTVTIANRVLSFAYGLYLSGWEQVTDPVRRAQLTDEDMASDMSDVTIGDGSEIHMELDDSAVSGSVGGIVADSNSLLTMGDNGKLSIVQDGGYSRFIQAIDSTDHSDITMGKDFQASVSAMGQVKSLYGLYAEYGGQISIGDDFQLKSSYTGDEAGTTQIGVMNFLGGVTLGNDSLLDVSAAYTGSSTAGTAISGARSLEGTSTFGDNLTIRAVAENYETVDGLRGFGVTAYPGTVKVGDGLSLTVSASALSDNASGPIVYGIRNSGTASVVTVGKDAKISVSAPSSVQDAAVIRSWSHGTTELGDGAVLTLNSAATENNNVVKADTAGTVTFDGAVTLSGSHNAIYSTGDGSSVSAVGNGNKIILCDLEAADSGVIKLNLNTANSLFRGKSIIDSTTSDDSTVDTTSADTELTLANSALWDMTGSSQVTDLTVDNGGIVNMQYNPDYQRLDMNTFSGSNGIFLMKTDLNSETDGDKVYMDNVAVGASGLVQVHDEVSLPETK